MQHLRNKQWSNGVDILTNPSVEEIASHLTRSRIDNLNITCPINKTGFINSLCKELSYEFHVLNNDKGTINLRRKTGKHNSELWEITIINLVITEVNVK